jgi:hypothetical protein
MKNFESISIKAIETIPGSDPNKAFLVLQNSSNGIAGKPVLNLVIFKIIGIILCKGSQCNYGKAD